MDCAGLIVLAAPSCNRMDGHADALLAIGRSGGDERATEEEVA